MKENENSVRKNEESVCDRCERKDTWECWFCCTKCFEDYGECPDPDCNKTKFIVDVITIVEAVKIGLAESVKDNVILDRLIRPIIDKLQAVLFDDCETYEEGEEE